MADQINTATPTIPSIETIPQTTETTHTSGFIVTLLLFIFPPIAWYFMWKEKRYYSWFVTLIIIYGVVYFLLFASQAFIVGPKLSALYQSMNTAQPTTSKILPFIMTILTLLQIGFGIYLMGKIKKGNVTKTNLLISVIILAFDTIGISFAAGSIMLSTILPIYNLTSQFGP